MITINHHASHLLWKQKTPLNWMASLLRVSPPKGPRPPPKHRQPTPLDNEAAVPLKDVEASYKLPGKKPPRKPYKPYIQATSTQTLQATHKPPPSN
ncbi:hypothetical protein GBA52_005283 [Prunus armeniaca]|nr:hypothetical protein GBA52_005283 [Prunus armeniaca]